MWWHTRVVPAHWGGGGRGIEIPSHPPPHRAEASPSLTISVVPLQGAKVSVLITSKIAVSPFRRPCHDLPQTSPSS